MLPSRELPMAPARAGQGHGHVGNVSSVKVGNVFEGERSEVNEDEPSA